MQFRTTLLLLAIPFSAVAGTFTLEQVLSAPFPSDLVASPDGSKLAWMLNERGARNIWVAAAPDYKGTRVTSYTDDDGQDIGQLHWTPDNRAVVYTRGGDLEFPGRPDPNPTADPRGVEQAIGMVVPGKKPRKLGLGHSPAISPKGDRIVFLRAGQIWICSLKDPVPPEMLVHARAGVTANEMEWSPDGSKLAYVSDRGNHAFVAVYDFNARTITYPDPGIDRDANPRWSPDGSQVAFTRISAAGGRGRGATGGQPWAIRVATVRNGGGRQIWRADPGMGSVFHAVVSEHQLNWASGDHIVFPWEKDGWCHLYSVALAGGAAKILTAGNFEVEYVEVDEAGQQAVFSSNP